VNPRRGRRNAATPDVAPAAAVKAAPGLLDRHLLVQTGKGGTGKTAITAALARLAARQGRRVLTCEVNARGRVASLLGGPPAGPEIKQVQENIWCVDVRPHEALIEYGLMKLRFRAVVDAVLENRLIRYFLQALPSLSEVVMLGKILFHVREEVEGRRRFDLVLLDAPATGHGAALLRVPQGVFDTVPAGPLKDDMEWMRDLLADPAQTALNYVTIPEEMPVNETLDLDRMAREILKIPLGVCFLNCSWPQRFAPGELERLPDRPPPLKEAVAAAARLQRHADRSAQQTARLRTQLHLPLVELPQLFIDRFGPAEVDVLAERIEAALRALPSSPAEPTATEGLR
jgi:anion-transporting  ArsA/GET3 family ATPase